MLDNALYELSGSTPKGVVSYLITSTQTSFAVRSGTTIIYENAFSFCDSLVTITLPDTLTTIQEDAFSQCNALKSLDIPDNVTTVGGNCFSFLRFCFVVLVVVLCTYRTIFVSFSIGVGVFLSTT